MFLVLFSMFECVRDENKLFQKEDDVSTRRVLFGITLGLLCLGLSMAQPAPASADNLTFNFVSNYRYNVQLEFYSQNYNRAWPGNGRAYTLYDYQIHTFSLNCDAGEKICWGAWDKVNSNLYWGTGINNSHFCSSCCYVCGADDPQTQELH